jgi:hypothetical protein
MGYATLCPAVLSAPRAMAAEIDTESIAEEIAQFHRRLRRRLEGWLARRRRLSEASRRARAVVLRQRRDGRFAREDGKHPVSAPGPAMHVEPRGAGPRGEGGDVADARAAADARRGRSPHVP